MKEKEMKTTKIEVKGKSIRTYQGESCAR